MSKYRTFICLSISFLLGIACASGLSELTSDRPSSNSGLTTPASPTNHVSDREGELPAGDLS